MISLPFERVAQVVAIAALGRDDDVAQVLQVRVGEFKIGFSEYVKSQIHLNIVGDLYGRSLKQYVQAYRFTLGEKVYRDTALAVLRFFYLDVAQFLINNARNVRVSVEVSSVGLPSGEIDAKAEKEKFVALLGKGAISASDIDSFEYAEILNDVLSLDDARDKIDNYVAAAILKKHAKEEQLRQINIRW